MANKVNPTARYPHFAVADWSGAVGPRQPGIAIALCHAGDEAPHLIRPGHIWSREEVFEWLLTEMPDNTLIGLDLSPALPFADAGAYFPRWEESPANAHDLWQFVDAICKGEPNFSVSTFVDHPEACRHFRRHGGRTGDMFGSGRGRLRQVEIRQRTHGLSPYSCLNLVGAAQVGKSGLTAMRMLARMGGRLPFWPYDPLPETGSAMVEIYTSLAARVAGMRSGISKMRDGASLDTALAALGSQPHEPLARYTDHATDAILTAAWLRNAASDRELWNPSGLADVAATEGWTFGVP